MTNDVHNRAKRFVWSIAMLASGLCSLVAIGSVFSGIRPEEMVHLLQCVAIPLTLNLLAYSFSRYVDTFPQQEPQGTTSTSIDQLTSG